MSSYLNPSPFNADENENDNLISKKKISHNRTQKRYGKEQTLTERVSNVLNTIHNQDSDEDPGSNLADFSPPPPPTSVGAQRTIAKEPMQNLGPFNIINSTSNLGYESVSLNNNDGENDAGNYDLNNFKKNYGDSKTNEEYYKKYIANYSSANASPPVKTTYYQASQDANAGNGTQNDILLTKLNYMIHLLEEKQDERTNNVTEEVVLYSFLGIFIIFIVDSFSRVGKYVR